MNSGYFRYPAFNKEQVIFVSEDDLWSVPREGGVARRLTSGLGRAEGPCLSPDGRLIAYTSTEEGQTEIYLMPIESGRPERITYLGAQTFAVGWSPEGELIFASDHGQPFSRLYHLYSMSIESREPQRLPLGPALHLSFGPNGERVLARNSSTRTGSELAFWKRYRGGTAGEMWVDTQNAKTSKNDFREISTGYEGNTARPTWLKDRLFFISDHEGIGDIFSMLPNGQDLKRHTTSKDYYVRGLNADGESLVYYAGGDIYTLNPFNGEAPQKLSIEYHSPRTQTNRKYISASQNLEDYELHPKGETAVISARGRVFSFDLWKGAVFQHGQQSSSRFRLPRFFNDGERILLLSDEGGEEAFEIHHVQNRDPVLRIKATTLGRALDVKLSPTNDEALIANHRNELIWLDLKTGESKVLDRSPYTRIYGYNWSPDGKYVAYSCSENQRLCAIRICEIQSGKVQRVTKPVLQDVNPVFDPLGEYLYFISYREFDPVYDSLHFDLGFPRGSKPYLLTLRKDILSPFSADYKSERRHKLRSRNSDQLEKAEISEGSQSLAIDFDGIENRIVAFPLSDGRYGQISASHDKIFFTRFAIEGALKSGQEAGRGFLEYYDFNEEKNETIANHLSSFRLSLDGKHLIYRDGADLRVLKAGEKPNKEEGTGRKSGWLELDRVQISVTPREEWKQMYREAWRLQRDHFWKEDMALIDWQKVHDRYEPLLNRISSRGELSDLLWEMQGELGTSHAYEFGGDYRLRPSYNLGFLGADWKFDEGSQAYELTEISQGDVWDTSASSPLARAGISLQKGDLLLAIDGEPLSKTVRPEQLLVHRAGKEISLTFKRAGKTETEIRSIQTLRSELDVRYRSWVDKNRDYVHQTSGGRVGYVHIPDMGANGYAEFHRGFLTELDCEALIIDVRYNGGGHVSQLVLEKLSRRRIGYCQTRWFGVQPYPTESPAGPMVALTNEYAGSDGDIFSHSFKLLKLGPLLGKRTWGGVIGINPSHPLTDGSVTTQPEYSFWFEDVGWRVENYGTDPDLEVEYPPSAYAKGEDPQLIQAILTALAQIKAFTVSKPLEKPKFNTSLPDIGLG